MTKTIAAGLFAAALLAGSAASAQQAVPLTLGLGNDGRGFALGYTREEGEFIDFLVKLERGKDYFFGGVSDERAHVAEVLDPAGRVLKSFRPIDDGLSGVEFRAPATATYSLRARQVDGGEDYPAPFGAYAGPDCRGGTTTRCTLTIGQARPGQRGRWDVLTTNVGNGQPGVSEHDYYKVRLQGGRTYTATLTAVEGGQPIRVSFFDANRRELAGTGRVFDGPWVRSVGVRFRPSRTGDYWVRAAGSFDRSPYDIVVR